MQAGEWMYSCIHAMQSKTSCIHRRPQQWEHAFTMLRSVFMRSPPSRSSVYSWIHRCPQRPWIHASTAVRNGHVFLHPPLSATAMDSCIHRCPQWACIFVHPPQASSSKCLHIRHTQLSIRRICAWRSLPKSGGVAVYSCIHHACPAHRPPPTPFHSCELPWPKCHGSSQL